MGFGVEFVPIYLHHPNVESVAICDSDEGRQRLGSGRMREELRKHYGNPCPAGTAILRLANINAAVVVPGF
jgi:predicted dehydrogenase